VNRFPGECLFALFVAVISLEQGAMATEPDRNFAPERSFISAASNGVGDASTAFPWSVASAAANPALLYSCRNGAVQVSRSVAAGFGRDSLFDRCIVPIAASYSRKRDAVALNLRALSSSAGLDEYEAAITYCKRVLSRVDRQGPLDLGVNLRYEYANWRRNGLDTLMVTRSYHSRKSGSTLRTDDTLSRNAPPEAGWFKENRVLLDFGVFKPEIASHVDCGIAIKNIGGFRWGHESPETVTQTDTARVAGDTAVLTTARTYDSAQKDYGGWVGAKYTTLSAALNFKVGIPASSVSFSFPIEAQLYGLFARHFDVACAIHAGVQVHLMHSYFLRFGYSKAPGITPSGAHAVTLLDNISLGASLLPPGLPLAIDCYFSHWDWGLSAAMDY
jgi:hypothetical protein